MKSYLKLFSHFVQLDAGNNFPFIQNSYWDVTKRFMKKALTILLLFVGISASQAQEIEFQASAPQVVAVGKHFRLVFSVNANPKSFNLPDIDGLTVLAGPSVSQSTSMSWVNGKMTQKVDYSYTYVLVAEKEGIYTIPSATIEVKKEKYESRPIEIEVIKENTTARANPGQNNTGTQTNQNQSSGSKDIFLRLVPDKTEVFLGEHMVVSLILYTNKPISGLEDMKKPGYKGFYTQVIEEPQRINLEPVKFNGAIYEAGLIQKMILYPQQSGTLEIESASLSLLIRQRSSSSSVFDDFFGTYQNVKKTVYSDPLKIKVKELPSNKPSNFTGAVGKFNLTSGINKTELKENEAITYKLSVSGNGNLKLIEAPKLIFPPDFEAYDPKISENIKNTSTGSSGSKTFEYLIIPRHPGVYTIPQYELAFFDPSTKTFKKLLTEEFVLNVQRDTAKQVTTSAISGLSKEELRFIGKDIQFISLKKTSFVEKDKVFFGSLIFWLTHLFSTIFFFVVFLLLYRSRKNRQNIVLVKNKKANKIAKKRLKLAESFLKSSDYEKFYEEVLKALWGYLSDKLNLPMAELSMDKVVSILEAQKVESSCIKQFTSIITTCEYARYAPIDGDSKMDMDYRKAIEVVSKFEQKLR